MDTATPTDADLERGLRNGRLVGHYLRILGWATLLSAVLTLVAGKGLRLDFTIVLLLWAGGGLLRGKEGFRKGAAILLGLHAVPAFVLLFLIVAIPGFSPSSLSSTRDLTTLRTGLLLAATAPPLVLLMSPSTRRGYRSGRGSDLPPPPGTLLGRLYYLLVPCVLVAVPAWIDFAADRTVLRSSTTFPGGSFASVRVIVETEKGSAPLYIACWALADSRQVGGSGDGRTILFHDVAVPIPHGKPVQFLFTPPLEPRDQANVVIVDKDGAVTRLDRRVTLANLALAESSIQGVKEFSEIRERLERALPPLTPAAP